MVISSENIKDYKILRGYQSQTYRGMGTDSLVFKNLRWKNNDKNNHIR